MNLNQLIIISSPVQVEDERLKINTLLKEDYFAFHLRKPDLNKVEFENLLKTISPLYLKKVVIHQHFDLIEKYRLKGIHFPEKYRNELSEKKILEIKKALNKKGMTLSTSFHQQSEAENQMSNFDYFFLSPVFDSISKGNYTANKDLHSLSDSISKSQKAFALGGVTYENLHQLLEMGYSGGAMLGEIWK